MADGWCLEEKCGKPAIHTGYCGKHTLERASLERAECLRIVNEPGIQWKVRRALLREKFGFAEVLIDELVGKTEPASDY